MTLSTEAQATYDQVKDPHTKLGELRRLAKALKKNHALAMELWSTGEFNPRMLAVLLMDKALLDQAALDGLMADLGSSPFDERIQIVDWLMANQLTKNKAGIRLLESWANSEVPLQRRLFWYRQARLRWTGQVPPDNTVELLEMLETGLADEVPEVQWAMNFTAGQIGTFMPEHRARCIALGERTGLYRDQVVHKGCTPNYLPEFIRIQAEKAGT